jgi:hypothetical protein
MKNQRENTAPLADSGQLIPLGIRPIYLLVVFWGEVHRGHFASLLLPSLLAPGNLPAVSSVQGSKLVICTTRADWEVVQRLPLFEASQRYVDTLWIEIEPPGPEVNKYLHSAAAFKRAVRRCWEDRACASFLVPDLILSDGALKYLRELVADRIVAALAPALRYDLDACLSALRRRGLWLENQPIAVSGRELAGLGLENLHSEIKRFEWNSPNFCREPISAWWRLGTKKIILHTTAWQMALVNFDALPLLNDASLDYTSHDGPFIEHNFYRFRESEALRLITDSDDVFYLSLAGESDFTFYPLKAPLLNRVPVISSIVKFVSLQLFMNGEMFDAFRRWAITVPVFIHAGPLSEEDRKQAVTTSSLLRRATVPPGLIPRLYGSLPTRPLLRSIIILLFKEPRQFWTKVLRRITGRRRTSGAPPHHKPQM